MILSKAVKSVARRLEQMPAEAPKNTMDSMIMLAEAIRFGYSQTLATWDFFDLPRALLHAVKDKGNTTAANECGERSDCVQVNLKAPEMLKELYELKKLLTRAMLFSKKRFEAFLFAAGFNKSDVLFRKRTARILKPAFTVICDKESKCLFVFIRGTRSIKDALTDVIGASVPFKLMRSMVSGHAHRGMLSAANWIEKHCTSILLNALHQYPDFKIKIVGHSLGGGTAALLTYKLREIKELSSCTCITFGPAACMTLELAEFGKPFITSIVNGSDIVPTLSASSIHDFISKGRIKDKSILTAVGSSLPFAKAIAEHAVTHCTEVVMKRRQGTSPLLPLSQGESSRSSETSIDMESMSDDDKYDSSSEGSDNDGSDDDEDEDELLNQVPTTSVNLDRHDLYPPGKIVHIATLSSSQNCNSNCKYSDEKRVHLYETPTQFYGKLRLSRGIILDHLTNKYLKKLQQLINQQEKEQFQYGG